MYQDISAGRSASMPPSSHAAASPGRSRKREFGEISTSSSAPAVLTRAVVMMPPAHPRPKSSSSSRQQGSGKTTSSPIIIIDADTPGTSIHSSSTPEIEEIDRSTFEQSAKKRKRAKFTTDPEYYDDLPYSPQDCFTSGLDQGCWPEGTSGEFWGKVLSRWEESLAVETVEERRGWFLRDVWEFMSDEESGEGRGEEE